jgi:FkbM family methyltransferase
MSTAIRVDNLGKCYRISHLNRAESRILVEDIPLSDRIGTVRFHTNARKDDGSHSLITGVPAESVEIVEVATSTVDRYCADAGLEPALLKIDVEGAEALVLDGAAAHLDGPSRPIIIMETADRLADQIGESTSSVLARLFRRSSRVFALVESRLGLREADAGAVLGELGNYLAIPEDSPRLGRIAGIL